MAQPLYAIPGLMNDARVWKNQADAFSPDRIVRVADSTGHDSIRALAAAALEQAPGDRFALAGFSLGGYVALEIMRRAPERVVALALVDTGPRADTAETTEMRHRMLAAAGSDPAKFEAVATAFLPRVVHPSRVDDRALSTLLISMAKSVGAEGFTRQQHAAIGRPDGRPMLADIACPTLVICGREDQITPLALSEEMAAMIPGARLVVIEDCGHMSPLEKPEAVTAALAEWLRLADAM
jgi:pimeloyl-ACP methyl ester carboxylesterase